jgi:hypothetical protein
MAFDDTYRESIQTKHIANVGFTSTAKGVTNESIQTQNPHQVIASQIPAVDVVGTYGTLVADGIGAGLVEKHVIKLTVDGSVNGNKAWYATEDNCTEAGHAARGTVRVKQWLRYANTEYKLRLYEDNGSETGPGTEIFPSETQFNWEYDPSAGIVYFDEDPSTNGKTTPLWAEVYTYVGDSVEDGLGAAGSELGDLTELFQDTNEPSGFIDRTSSTITFDDGTRNFTISGTEFSYYIEGEKFTKNGAYSVQIPDSEGMNYVYFNGETLTTSSTWSYDYIYNKAYVAAVYWDSSAGNAIYIGDERHGITMDGQTHAYLHVAFGTQYDSGLALSSIQSDQDGSSNDHATFAILEGSIRDEDLLHLLAAKTKNGAIPVFYKTGAAGDWAIDRTPDSYPILTNAADLPSWNEWTGATWQKTQLAGNGRYVLSHIFATNGLDLPFIAVAGQAEYSTLSTARDGANEEINNLITAGLPFAEYVPIATVIYEGDATFTNTPRAIVVTDADGNDYVDWRSSGLSPSAASVNSHANLIHRDLANQHPANAIQTSTANFDGALSSADTEVQAALDTLDDAVQANTDNLATASGVLQTQIDSNDTDISNLQSDLATTSGTLQTNIDNNYTTLDTKIDTVSGTLHDEILALGEAQNEFLELNDVEVESYTASNMLYTSSSGVRDTSYMTWDEENGEVSITSPTASGLAYLGPAEFNMENGDASSYLYFATDDAFGVGFDGSEVFGITSDGIALETGGPVDTISTTVDSGSLDTELPTAKAVWDYVEAKPTTFLDLTDTFSTYLEGRIPFETASGITHSGDFIYENSTKTLMMPNIGLTGNLDISGDFSFDRGQTVSHISTQLTDLSTDTDLATGAAIYTLVSTASGILSTAITNNYNTLVNLVDTTSGTLQQAIDDLETSTIAANIWEVVDTPFEQIRPKVEHQGKAMYTAGNLTIGGDLTVSGTTTTVHSEELTVADKVITVNAGESGAGITGSQYAGIEVDRGSETNYMFVFDEVQDNFRVGISGSLQAVATREDSPIDTRVAWWNDSEVRFDTGGDTYMTVDTSGHQLDMVVNTANVFSSTATVQRLGATTGANLDLTATQASIDIGGTGTFSTTADSQVVGVSGDTTLSITQSTDTAAIAAAGTTEFTVTTAGVALKSGTSVNEISTALSAASTDDQLATAKAIYDEIIAISGTVTALDHNDDLASLQGGTTDEYYHLTSNEYSAFSSDGSTFTFSQALGLATGTTVNEIVTTAITSANTDDQLATAAAIYTTISGMGIIDGTPDHMLYIDNGGNLASTANMTYDADGTVNVLSLTDDVQRIGDADGSYVAVSASGVEVGQNSVEVIYLSETSQIIGSSGDTSMSIDQDADTITFSAGGTNEAFITTSGLALRLGTSANEILTEADGLSDASTDDQLATAALIWDEMVTMSGVIQTDIDNAIDNLSNNYYNKTEIDGFNSDIYSTIDTTSGTLQSYIDAIAEAQNEFLELEDVEVASYTAGNVLFTTASGVTDDDSFTYDSGSGLFSTTAITLGTGGSVNEIVTTVTSGTTDSQLPTAKAVWDLTEAAAAAVHIHYDVDATHVSDTSWTYGSGFSETPDGLQIYVNGVKQRIGSDYDCTVDVPAGVLTITFNYSVRTSDWVNVNYYA